MKITSLLKKNFTWIISYNADTNLKERNTMLNAIVKKIFVLHACFLLTAFAISSQEQHNTSGNKGTGTTEEPYIVPRTDSGIKVDAVLDEDAWKEALTLELNYEVRPGENVTPPVRTEVLLTYDDKNFYAAFRCYDPDPSAIRAHLRDRDTLGGDDWIALILDTFNDERRSFDFIVTSLGVQFDQIEAQTGEDNGWDAIWDSAGQITDWGYAIEIAIPFSSLRFQRKDGPQIWGFDAVRRYPRSHAYHIGLFPRDRSNNCYLCQAIKIKGFDNVSPGRSIEINPTVTAARTDERPEFPLGDMEKRDQDAEVGLTARWGMTPNLTLSLTANPDFSQVEADALQLDINQPFALFYPERRPFFTEGADFFNTLEGAIYSRTMRDPSWGLKLTGKERSNTIGTYVVRDDITNLIFPGSQGSNSTSLQMPNTSSVFRYKRDIGSHYTVGLLATDREGNDYFNRLFGFDLDFRVTPTNQLQLQVLGSRTRYPDETADSFDQPHGAFSDWLVSFEYDHYTRTWGWWADYEQSGPDFRADLGFIPMVGFRNIEGGVLHTWNAKPGDWWSMFRVGSDLNYYEDWDGNLLNKRASLWFNYNGAMQSYLSVRGEKKREAFNYHEFDITSFTLQGGFLPTENLEVNILSLIGDRVDYANTRQGKRFRINPWLSYNFGKHLRLGIDHTYEKMTVQDARLYTANISQASAVYQFNVRTFIRSIFQYVNYDYNPGNYTFDIDPEYKRFFTQLLFSYKINARTVLFLGYSDNYFGNQDFSLKQSDRTFFVKLGYAWEL